MTTFDVTGVIRKFGGRAQLYRKLCLAKIQISHRTIDNWIYHGIIPMNRFMQLMALAKDEGFKLKLDDHIITKNDKPSRNDSAAVSGKN
jgi:hypothetical protein